MKIPRVSSGRKRRRVLARHGHGNYWRPVGFYKNRPQILDRVFCEGAFGICESLRCVVDQFSSRVCPAGTRSCVVAHTTTPVNTECAKNQTAGQPEVTRSQPGPNESLI